MKRLKLFCSTLIISFIINNYALSCNFNFKSFGSSPEEQSNLSLRFQFKDNKNNFTEVFPIENFCSETDLKGTVVTFLYIENGLAKISIERHNFKDRNLLKYATLKFGDFNRSKAQEGNNWTGSHFWNLNNQIVGYVAVDNSLNQFEKIELTSILYAQNLKSNSPTLEKK